MQYFGDLLFGSSNKLSYKRTENAMLPEGSLGSAKPPHTQMVESQMDPFGNIGIPEWSCDSAGVQHSSFIPLIHSPFIHCSSSHSHSVSFHINQYE